MGTLWAQHKGLRLPDQPRGSLSSARPEDTGRVESRSLELSFLLLQRVTAMVQP